MLGPEVSTPVVWLLAIALIALWFGSHWFKRFLKDRTHHLGGFAVRVIIGTAAIWAIWQALGRFLLLQSDWSLVTNAFIGALAMEIILFLYQLEKRIVDPKLGKLMLFLRMLAVLCVLAILVQPVFAHNAKIKKDRNVIVLVDDSASMQIADTQMTVEERMALAQFHGIDALKNRPAFVEPCRAAQAMIGKLNSMATALSVPEGFGATEEANVLDKQRDSLTALLKEATETAAKYRESFRAIKELPNDLRLFVVNADKFLGESFPQRIADVQKSIEGKRVTDIQAQIKTAASVLQRATERGPEVIEALDRQYYATVPEDARKTIDAFAAKTRAELAKEAMTRPRANGKSVLDALKEKYTVHFMRFGKTTADVPEYNFGKPADGEEFTLRTNITGALKQITQNYSDADSLAGVALLSDARHNTEVPVDDVARGMGIQGTPVHAVLVGSERGGKDAAIVSLECPQAIFLGDRVRVKCDLRADGLRGQKVKLTLSKDGAPVDTEMISPSQENFRSIIKLADAPPAKGVFKYTVKIDPLEGELFANNNEWSFEVAVSDDRTNVLIIEDRPRWEFRYLRNLFDSRDKSVHLQYVLMHPDTLHGQEPNPIIHADASREFGKSEATRLPEKPEQWKQFDAIIIGDVQPAALGEQTWEIIKECVEKRGAMLIMIAGPNAMPHAYTNKTFQDLAPINYDKTLESLMEPPEPGYRLALTNEGVNNLIFQQTSSGVENTHIWESMPVLRWRHPVLGVKETAQVLAYAKPVPLDDAGNEIPTDDKPNANQDPAQALLEQKKMQAKNALVVASQFGSGKVLMLNFDHTWRFRYGIGDTYHHRFWGQLLRWGTGENLRAGTNLARLGTDKLTYEIGEPVHILTKLINQDYSPVVNSESEIQVFRGEEKVLQRKLEYRKDSHGMYDAIVDGIKGAGEYRIEVTGKDVERLLAGSDTKKLETKFTIVSNVNPVEFGDLSVNRDLAKRMASLSGGATYDLITADRIVEAFGPPSKEIEEARETSLWDNWFLLLLTIGALTAEWLVRRRAGLI